MARRTVLRTERLVLTTWLPGDVEALFELHSDPEVMRWVRHGRPETRQETEALLASYVQEQDTRGWTKWRLTDHDGELVGRAGFGTSDGVRELGYTLRRDRWGKGLATEIAAALVEWHRTQAPDEPLYALAVVENIASRRVLEKVGFTFVRLTDYKGEDCALYELPG